MPTLRATRRCALAKRLCTILALGTAVTTGPFAHAMPKAPPGWQTEIQDQVQIYQWTVAENKAQLRIHPPQSWQNDTLIVMDGKGFGEAGEALNLSRGACITKQGQVRYAEMQTSATEPFAQSAADATARLFVQASSPTR